MDLSRHGYHTRPQESVVLDALLARPGRAIRVLLLQGAPGTGKTFLAECLAAEIGASYEYQLCHNWLSDEELFIGIDIGNVAVGVARHEDAYRPGLLLRAVQASQQGRVVVCIDEIDKAPQRAEALLLDFLQHARVYGPRGECWQGVAENITVVLTSNGQRQLMEATLRRATRLTMQFLPEEVERDLLRKWTGASASVVRTVVQFAQVIRANGATSPSIQEMCYLLYDMRCARSAADTEVLIRSSLVKVDEDWAALTKAVKNPAATIWGEWQR